MGGYVNSANILARRAAPSAQSRRASRCSSGRRTCCSARRTPSPACPRSARCSCSAWSCSPERSRLHIAVAIGHRMILVRAPGHGLVLAVPGVGVALRDAARSRCSISSCARRSSPRRCAVIAGLVAGGSCSSRRSDAARADHRVVLLVRALADDNVRPPRFNAGSRSSRWSRSLLVRLRRALHARLLPGPAPPPAAPASPLASRRRRTLEQHLGIPRARRRRSRSASCSGTGVAVPLARDLDVVDRPQRFWRYAYGAVIASSRCRTAVLPTRRAHRHALAAGDWCCSRCWR